MLDDDDLRRRARRIATASFEHKHPPGVRRRPASIETLKGRLHRRSRGASAACQF
jgi:hypothetical protein